MAEPSKALYDFAISTHGDTDFERLTHLVEDLASKPPSPSVELYGRASTGEILALLRFPFSAYSGALRQRMDREAQRLKGKLVEPELLAPGDRQRFYTLLKGFEVRVDVGAQARDAVEAFRHKLGLAPGSTAYRLQFDSADGVASALARCIAEGSLLVPARKPPAAGARVNLLFLAPNIEPIEAEAVVLELRPGSGFDAGVDPNDSIRAFLARQAAAARQGRRLTPEGGRRQHPRFVTCLQVGFDGYAELAKEYATNLSKGGLFVRTSTPPPLRAKVLLRIALPDGSSAETDAEVVHVVTAEEAAVRATSPGAGLAFSTGDEKFRTQIESFLQKIQESRKRPQVLVVDDDAFFRSVLKDALGEAGIDVRTAANGEEALRELVAGLFETDLVMLDLHMPGLGGAEFIDRVRRLGGEMDLRIVVLSSATSQESGRLVGPRGANDAIHKGTPLEEIVARVKRVLGDF